MPTQTEVTSSAREEPTARPTDRLWLDGIAAGLIGAAVIALWFLVLDTASGRPFYTPSLLGTALYRRHLLGTAAGLPVSFEMVVAYTWVHGLIFCLIGCAASWLVALAEKRPDLGFGILLFFVVFEAGFVGVVSAFAGPVLQALAWPAILVGNLLAATAMGAYLWRRHPNLTIRP